MALRPPVGLTDWKNSTVDWQVGQGDPASTALSTLLTQATPEQRASCSHRLPPRHLHLRRPLVRRLPRLSASLDSTTVESPHSRARTQR